MCGKAVRTLVIILSTSSKFCGQRGSPPKIEKLRIIPFAQIALIICPLMSVGSSFPPSKSQVSGL